jgi:hypothetical protein
LQKRIKCCILTIICAVRSCCPVPGAHNKNMANREELSLIRGARAGRADAQLALGKLYLYGSAGLPKSLPTALHWLGRAAQQDCPEAYRLIGSHIPFDVAARTPGVAAEWFERAYDEGVGRAGVVLAQLLLEGGEGGAGSHERRRKALSALEAAARAGDTQAHWLLGRYRARSGTPQPERSLAAALPAPLPVRTGTAQLDVLWQTGQWEAWLEHALPQARALAATLDSTGKTSVQPGPADASLLARCARLLENGQGGQRGHADEILRLRELAAGLNEPEAQCALGLWHARMQLDGTRLAGVAGSASFKKAVRWLTLAGEQGLAEAWYALSRIYAKPEFSQRNVADAQRHLERAASMGFRDAQLECGNLAWRGRREQEDNDVKAAYWYQKAAAQGCGRAAAALEKIAPPLVPEALAWSRDLPPGATLEQSHPLLAARLELARQFGLSRAETLLLDIRSADRGHCLLIDIRASYGRSKRRLVMVDGVRQRQALDQISRVFEGVEPGPQGPEGNYRQRLYRLKTVLPAAVASEDPEVGTGLELAA